MPLAFPKIKKPDSTGEPLPLRGGKRFLQGEAPGPQVIGLGLGHQQHTSLRFNPWEDDDGG